MKQRANVLFAVMAMVLSMGSTSQATPEPFQPITIDGYMQQTSGGFVHYWGTTLQPGGTPHPFGGTTTYVMHDVGSLFEVNVWSGVISPDDLPPGVGFGGFITIDFSDGLFGSPGLEGFHWVDIGPIKPPGAENYIISAHMASGAGVVTTDGVMLRWEADGAWLTQEPIVTMVWWQVPSPGALALLGVATLIGPRRRRD